MPNIYIEKAKESAQVSDRIQNFTLSIRLDRVQWNAIDAPLWIEIRYTEEDFKNLLVYLSHAHITMSSKDCLLGSSTWCY